LACETVKQKSSCRIVLVTVPDLKTARRIAKSLLRDRLIACANLVPRIESHYVWKGKAEQVGEVLMILKTVSTRLSALEKAVAKIHPYDTPEFVVLNIASGSKKYLTWLAESCAR
jgi:periplasmic divalent cation tolerance protein